ncbi:uncharacterized protein LOC119099763 [Pollicipes pollicipes]|uniref:uncharacterized protein LOC119099763 n=1 Tax=Pollicipes pollicipes TaxID=41117 RepID=UPI001884D63E|nr:uncharacterized protein LOC119099763 [Pollicipes pollicipes]
MRNVTYLAKVRAAAAPAGWPDARAPGDLVCPRCAALVNDIVIYESRLADMTQQLVAMVTATLAARCGAEAGQLGAADKLKCRRPRKTIPRKSSQPSDAEAVPDLNAAAGQARPRRSCVASGDSYGDSEDGDDPTIVASRT